MSPTRAAALAAVLVAAASMPAAAAAPLSGPTAQRPEARSARGRTAPALRSLPAQRIDPALLEAMEQGGAPLPVFILLDEPGPSSSAEAARLAAIGVAQDALLLSLPAQAFVLRHRLRNVPALAGEVDARGLAALAHREGVAWVYEDREVVPLLAEGKPLIHADFAQAQGLTGAGQTVAVIDTGVNGGHPDFAGATIINGWDFGDGDPDASDDCLCSGRGHGTAVAGIVARPDGVAPSADVVALKIASCFADCRASSSAIAMALDWCITNRATYGITVANISFGGGHFSVGCDAADPVTADIARRAADAGIAIFAASGNDGYRNGIAMPACLSSVISVGAVYDADVGPLDTGFCRDASSSADQVICYSNDADILDLLASSQCATTTGAACFNGTSAASPYAAAAAALLGEWNPALTVVERRDLLISTGDPIVDPKTGRSHPRINLERAITESPEPPASNRDDALFVSNSPSRNADGTLDLEWAAADGALSYDVYEGNLGSPWAYSHDTLLACELPAWQRVLENVNPGAGNRYYLVSPRSLTGRTTGLNSIGAERPLPPVCQDVNCTRATCSATVLGDFPAEIDAAFSTGPCDPSLTGYILGDASYDQYLLVDLNVLDSGAGATGEVLSTAVDLYFDGTEYLRVLLIESCAAQPLTARIRVIEYEPSALGPLLVDGTARLEPWFDPNNWAWADISPDGVTSPPPPYPYLASLTTSSLGAPTWAQVTLRHAYRYDEPNFVQWRSIWAENFGDAAVDVRLRVRSAAPLLGAEITAGPVTGFPVDFGPLGGGPYDDGDAHAWFDALPTVTSCLPDGEWLPWLNVTLRDGASWYDTFWFNNSANCWTMDFDANVSHLSQCCN